MPIKIPHYEQRVSLDALPGYRQQLHDQVGSAMGQLGEGIARAGQGAAAIFQKVQDEQDDAAVRAAYVKITENKRLLLDGDHGLAAQRGTDAKEGSKWALEHWKKASDGVLEKLTESQRRKFQPVLDRESEAFHGSVNHHLAREGEAVEKQTYEAALTAASNDAKAYASRGEFGVVGPQGPEAGVHDAIQNGLGVIDQMARTKGWPPGYAEQQRKEFATGAYVDAVEHLVGQGRVQDAKAYLADARQFMDEGLLERSGILKVLAAGEKNDTARGLADKAWVEAGGDPAKALDAVRGMGIEDTEVFDEALQRVQRRGSEVAAARRQADSPRLGRIEQAVLRGQAVSTIDPNGDFQALSDEGKADALRLMKAEKARRNDLGAQARREQLERDKYALALFDGLDLAGAEGKDKVSADIDKLSRDTGASPTALEVIRSRQKSAQARVGKDGGVSYQDFRAKQLKWLSDAGVKGKAADKYMRHMADKYVGYEDPKNPGAPPPPELVEQWGVEWFTRKEKSWARDPLGIEEEIEAKKDAADDPRPRRTINGETRAWDGKEWVKP